MNSVSIIITTYKRSLEVLERAIMSALNQTYNNIEIIVINDFPDNNVVIEELKCKYKSIKFISNSSNKGANFSRNLGIKMAKGEYIALLDDDDEWMPQKIEREISLFEDDVKLVYCTGIEKHQDGGIRNITYIENVNQGNKIENILSKNIMGGCSFPLVKKDVFEEIGCFDELLESSQDYDMWIRITLKFKVKFLDEKLVIYHVSSDSITSNISKKWKGYKAILKKFNSYYLRYPNAKCKFYNNILDTCIVHHDYAKVLKVLLKSFSFFPYNLKLFSYLGKVVFNNKIKNNVSI